MKKILLSCFIGVCMCGCFLNDGARMEHEVSQKVLTGENAIYNYEWFIQTKNTIKQKYQDEIVAERAVESFRNLLPKDTSKWSASDKGEYQRLMSELNGIRYSTNEVIKDYNAKASMKTKNLFKDNLPTNIFRGVSQALEFKYGGND